MKQVPRARFLRVFTILFISLAIILGWEISKDLDRTVVEGEVVNVERVFGGRWGDNKKFTIQYSADGEKRVLTTSRGIYDHLVTYRKLQEGDKVILSVNTTNPDQASFNSINSRYPVSLAIGSLIIIFAVTVILLITRGRIQIK